MKGKKRKMKPIINRLLLKLIKEPSRAGVSSARNRIDAMVENARKKRKFTHFLAIPMTDKGIAENYEKFKSTVLNETGKDSKGVWEGIFQKPEKMHLTLGMLELLEDKDIKTAVETLENCREKIITPIVEKYGPIKIKAQGLGSFNKNVEKVRVLYGSVSTDNNVLQELTEKIAECFVEKDRENRVIEVKPNSTGTARWRHSDEHSVPSLCRYRAVTPDRQYRACKLYATTCCYGVVPVLLYFYISTWNDNRPSLMKKEEIKLHLTLMNVSFAIGKKRTGRPRNELIDATNIMKEHNDYLFGESVVNTVQICVLGPRAENGYYRITSEINLTD